MQITGTLEGNSIIAEVKKAEEVGTLIKTAREQGGFMLGLSLRPEPFTIYKITMTTEHGFDFTFQAKVLQIFEQGDALNAAFQLEEWTQSKELELQRKLKEALTTTDDDEAEGEAFGRAPIYRIKQMDSGEKMRLAMKAERNERKILCRDSSAQVLLSLLANPRIEGSDVLQIVKSTHASSGVLQRVAQDRRWASNSEIQTAIVRNPKTPTPIAIRLLEVVPTRELREMAKMGSIRENVRRAAFRLYTKRSNRRR